jgi:hypothetical protein
MSLWGLFTGQHKEDPSSEAYTQEIRALERRSGRLVSDSEPLHWEHSLLGGWRIERGRG